MNNTNFTGICIYEKFPNQISQKLVINWVNHHGVTLPCKHMETLPKIYTFLKNSSLYRI